MTQVKLTGALAVGLLQAAGKSFHIRPRQGAISFGYPRLRTGPLTQVFCLHKGSINPCWRTSKMKAVKSDASRSVLRGGVMLLILLTFLPLAGCVAQQPDLKQTEKNLQLRIKQSSDESAQTRARQSQEISVLREQELPQLRGELELALHQAQELQGKQENLKTQIQESLNAQDRRNDVVIGTILLRMEKLEKRV